MPKFFETKTKQDAFDVEMANVLADAVTAARLCQTTPARSKWVGEFVLLRKEHDKELIRSVMEWYVTQIREPYTPKTLSGRTFRIRFEGLLLLYRKSGRSVVVSEEASVIISRLGGLNWPGDEKKDEAAFVQISLENYRNFLQKIEKAGVEKLLPYPFVQHVFAAGGDIRGFVMSWVMDIHRMAWTWGNWQGDLLYFAIHPRSGKFQTKIQSWCNEYWGPGDHINKVFCAIDED